MRRDRFGSSYGEPTQAVPEPQAQVPTQPVRPPVKRLPVDSRVVGKVMGSSTMMRGQGSGLMKEWGGPQRYKELARMPVAQRSVYESILGGVSDETQLALATGLSPEQVEKAIKALKKKGLITIRG